MKIITTTVSTKGFGDESHNLERIRNAKKAVEETKKMNAQILSLPAGYLYVEDEQNVDRTANDIRIHAKDNGISIMFGIDQKYKNLSGDWTNEVKTHTLPWFGYIWSHTERRLFKLRQRSVNNKDQYLTPDSACKELRAIDLNGFKISILMCGEIFNKRIRETLIENRSGVNLIIDLAHIGSRFRIFQPMKILSKNGFSSLVSSHVNKRNAVKYHYSSNNTNLSDRAFDAEIITEPRIEMKLWDI